MTKLLHKAFEAVAKQRRREDQCPGMPWSEIRERYPHQWLLLEATEAHSAGGQRIVERLAVLETCPDGLSAMRRYGEIHQQDPHRELYVLHTERETVDIEEVYWAGIRKAS